LVPVNSKISHCLQVEELLVSVETLKYLVLKASALLQVVSVNPSRHLIAAYLAVA
jgi:hypothetical protein